MQAFKLENFSRAHPDTDPPEFSPLTASEEASEVAKLLKQAQHSTGSPEELLRQLAKQAQPIATVNLDERPIELRRVFEMCGISPESVLFVQWGPFRNIDRFNRVELEKYFYDIWYPAADDIELFDGTAKWIIFVAHYGAVRVWRPIDS